MDVSGTISDVHICGGCRNEFSKLHEFLDHKKMGCRVAASVTESPLIVDLYKEEADSSNVIDEKLPHPADHVSQVTTNQFTPVTAHNIVQVTPGQITTGGINQVDMDHVSTVTGEHSGVSLAMQLEQPVPGGSHCAVPGGSHCVSVADLSLSDQNLQLEQILLANTEGVDNQSALLHIQTPHGVQVLGNVPIHGQHGVHVIGSIPLTGQPGVQLLGNVPLHALHLLQQQQQQQQQVAAQQVAAQQIQQVAAQQIQQVAAQQIQQVAAQQIQQVAAQQIQQVAAQLIHDQDESLDNPVDGITPQSKEDPVSYHGAIPVLQILESQPEVDQPIATDKEQIVITEVMQSQEPNHVMQVLEPALAEIQLEQQVKDLAIRAVISTTQSVQNVSGMPVTVTSPIKTPCGTQVTGISTVEIQVPVLENKALYKLETQRLVMSSPTKSAEKPRVTYRCSYTDCSYTTQYSKNVERHMVIHTGERRFHCTECDARFNRSDKLKNHLRIHSGERPFTCDQCDYCCVDNSSLKKHKRIHSDERPYRCQVCTYASRNSSQLTVHLRTHTGDKPFMCPECNATFKVKSDLKRHRRMHSGEKPFICDLCNFRTAVNSNLKAHIKTYHCEENMMQCSICDFKSSSKRVFKTHQKVHEPAGEVVKCDECSYTCGSQRLMKGHQMSHSDERPFSCAVCKYNAKTRTCLTSHMRNRHPKEYHSRHGRRRKKPTVTMETERQKLTQRKRPMMTAKCWEKYRCDICGVGFVRADSLRSHLRSHKEKAAYDSEKRRETLVMLTAACATVTSDTHRAEPLNQGEPLDEVSCPPHAGGATYSISQEHEYAAMMQHTAYSEPSTQAMVYSKPGAQNTTYSEPVAQHAQIVTQLTGQIAHGVLHNTQPPDQMHHTSGHDLPTAEFPNEMHATAGIGLANNESIKHEAGVSGETDSRTNQTLSSVEITEAISRPRISRNVTSHMTPPGSDRHQVHNRGLQNAASNINNNAHFPTQASKLPSQQHQVASQLSDIANHRTDMAISRSGVTGHTENQGVDVCESSSSSDKMAQYRELQNILPFIQNNHNTAVWENMQNMAAMNQGAQGQGHQDPGAGQPHQGQGNQHQGQGHQSQGHNDQLQHNQAHHDGNHGNHDQSEGHHNHGCHSQGHKTTLQHDNHFHQDQNQVQLSQSPIHNHSNRGLIGQIQHNSEENKTLQIHANNSQIQDNRQNSLELVQIYHMDHYKHPDLGEVAPGQSLLRENHLQTTVDSNEKTMVHVENGHLHQHVDHGRYIVAGMTGSKPDAEVMAGTLVPSKVNHHAMLTREGHIVVGEDASSFTQVEVDYSKRVYDNTTMSPSHLQTQPASVDLRPLTTPTHANSVGVPVTVEDNSEPLSSSTPHSVVTTAASSLPPDLREVLRSLNLPKGTVMITIPYGDRLIHVETQEPDIKPDVINNQYSLANATSTLSDINYSPAKIDNAPMENNALVDNNNALIGNNNALVEVKSIPRISTYTSRPDTYTSRQHCVKDVLRSCAVLPPAE